MNLIRRRERVRAVIGYMDIHSHFVYGVDDGAQTQSDMEAMLDAAYADGIAFLFSTPHVTPGVYPFDKELYARHLEEARQYCRSRQYLMRLYAGAEVMYTPAIERYAVQRRLPTLGNTHRVLMEFTPEISYQEIEAAAQMLEEAGYRLVVAHMERYACLAHGQNARRLKQAHALSYQVNASTVIGGKGFLSDRRMRGWLREELIDFVACDAHDSRRRPFQMHAAYQALCAQCSRAYARRLTGLT
ncbi:MAG: CpsB/CapC family capsule biosynthesis tyrosine phosphatase [Candidatus Ventricola sp.]